MHLYHTGQDLIEFLLHLESDILGIARVAAIKQSDFGHAPLSRSILIQATIIDRPARKSIARQEGVTRSDFRFFSLFMNAGFIRPAQFSEMTMLNDSRGLLKGEI